MIRCYNTVKLLRLSIARGRLFARWLGRSRRRSRTVSFVEKPNSISNSSSNQSANMNISTAEAVQYMIMASPWVIILRARRQDVLTGLPLCRWKFAPGRIDNSPSFPHRSSVANRQIVFLSSQFRGKRMYCLSRNQQFDPTLQITRVAAVHESYSHMDDTCIRGHGDAF